MSSKKQKFKGDNTTRNAWTTPVPLSDDSVHIQRNHQRRPLYYVWTYLLTCLFYDHTATDDPKHRAINYDNIATFGEEWCATENNKNDFLLSWWGRENSNLSDPQIGRYETK